MAPLLKRWMRKFGYSLNFALKSLGRILAGIDAVNAMAREEWIRGIHIPVD